MIIHHLCKLRTVMRMSEFPVVFRLECRKVELPGQRTIFLFPESLWDPLEESLDPGGLYGWPPLDRDS